MGTTRIAVFWVILGLWVLSAFSDDVVLPAKVYPDDVEWPPLKTTLVRHEQEARSRKSLKKIEHIVRSAVLDRDEPADKSRSHRRSPVKKQRERNRFMPEKTIVDSIDKESLLLLDEVYKDPELTQKKISLHIKKMSVKKAIEVINKLSQMSFVVDPHVTEMIEEVHVNEVPLALALQLVFNSTRPRLGLVKTFGVWRIVHQALAITLLRAHEQKLRELDYASVSYTVQHAKWDELFKTRIEKLWTGIIGEAKGTPHAYIAFDDKSKKIFFKGRKRQVRDFQAILKEVDLEIPQVRLDVRVIIADKSFDESLGFQWSGRYDRAMKTRHLEFASFGAKQDASGNATVTTPFGAVTDWSLNLIPGWKSGDSVAGLAKQSGMFSMPFIFRNADYTKLLNLTLNAAENRHEIKTILKPSLLVNSEETAEILVGDSMPLQTQVAESIGSNISNVTTTQYKDIGIKVKVKPEVSSGGESVFLDIFLENSSLSPLDKEAYAWQQGNQNYSIGYTIKTSRSKNRVLLRSGQTTLISGLIFNTNDTAKTGVPGLQDIPLLGWFFRGSKKSIKDYQLLIFITPVVM